jgi:hypothetical protein
MVSMGAERRNWAKNVGQKKWTNTSAPQVPGARRRRLAPAEQPTASWDLADGHFATADKSIRAALEANTKAWNDYRAQQGIEQ